MATGSERPEDPLCRDGRSDEVGKEEEEGELAFAGA